MYCRAVASDTVVSENYIATGAHLELDEPASLLNFLMSASLYMMQLQRNER